MATEKIPGLSTKKAKRRGKQGKQAKTFFFEETDEYKVKKAIFEAVCEVCGANRPSITGRTGRIRYTQCRKCHKTAKLYI